MEDAARELIHDYLERHDLAVLATASPSGSPEALMESPPAQISLDFRYPHHDAQIRPAEGQSRVALVIGLESETTLQLEGEAEELAGEALAEAKAIYFQKWPDGRAREAWPNITYFKVRPHWFRHSDFSQPPPRIVELDAR